MQPRTIAFGQLSKGERSVKDFAITVTKPDVVKISGVKLDDPRFSLSKKSGENEGSSQYELVFKGSKTIERIDSSVRIELVGSDADSVEVPVRVSVVGNLRYSKNLFFLKRGGEFKPRDVTITTRSGKPIKLMSAKDASGKLKLRITEKEGQRTTIQAEVADPKVNYAKPVLGKITVKTSDKDEPELEITYTISESIGKRLDMPKLPLPNLRKKPGPPPAPR